MTTETVARTDKYIPCKLHYKKVRAAADSPALSELFAGRESPSILGGNIAKAEADGFSYWAAEPKEVFEFHAGQKDPFGKLQKALAKYRPVKDFEVDSRWSLPRTTIRGGNDREGENDLPKGIFRGGWIGYFSYDLGRYIEPTAFRKQKPMADDLKMPLIRLCFYDRVIAYDHIEGVFWLIALQLPGDSQRPEEKLAALEQVLAESRKICVPPLYSWMVDIDNIDFSQIRSNMDKDYYLRMVEKIKRYIYDGDVYQINFSQRFECVYRANPIELYHWQNRHNPSGYAAYIDGGGFHIVSASPEMFITIKDDIIKTKPIKGTRPHLNETGHPQAKQINAKNFDELLDSEKEQAELNMIIDLERNDVAKICEPGTRCVIQPRTIETYPTVFHAVATVDGRLRNDITFCAVLKAMFPGGSITGAPKIRAMEIINETEPTDRGVYTGSIGFIGIDGSVCLNIAIRTIIITEQKAFVQTGGGIVADSDPQAEWEETITKARALLAGIRAIQTSEQKKQGG
jgi:para-aminobenzoate synthetase component 1